MCIFTYLFYVHMDSILNYNKQESIEVYLENIALEINHKDVSVKRKTSKFIILLGKSCINVLKTS